MNIRLRAVEIGDADLIYRWENSYSLWGVSSTRAPFSHYAIEQYVKGTQNEDIYSSKQIRFMIDALDEGEVKTVGCVDLYDLEPQHSRAGVGIFVQEGDYRRRHESARDFLLQPAGCIPYLFCDAHQQSS
jgi:diamine N-acetyltransferase